MKEEKKHQIQAWLEGRRLFGDSERWGPEWQRSQWSRTLIEPFQRETESTLRKHRTWGRNILMDAQPCGLSTFLLVKNLECLFQVWPWTSDCGHQTPLVLPPTPSPHILETSHQTQWSRVSWAPYIMCHIKWASQGQRWFWVLQVEAVTWQVKKEINFDEEFWLWKE